MKKILITIMVALIALTVSCGSDKGDNKNEETTVESNSNNEVSGDTNEKSKESESDKNTSEIKGNKTESPTSIKESGTSTNGKKKIYKDKLDKIEEEVKDLKSTYGESTAGRKNAAGLEYDRWDKALNEIYNELKKDLPKGEMSKLEQEEKNWIKSKEDKALNAAAEFKGGTEENVAYNISLANTTKERCYELVEKYMK